MRVEVFPFAHAFRKGSKLRLYIEAPTGHTGFWAFAPVGGPAINTVLHDAGHPSRLVLGELRGETAQAPLPACDTLRNQPCRPDPLAGSGAGARKRTSARTRCVRGRRVMTLRSGGRVLRRVRVGRC